MASTVSTSIFALPVTFLVFLNDQATSGAPMTVDAQGPVEINDAVELSGFAFHVYDVDVTTNRLTMTLVAKP